MKINTVGNALTRGVVLFLELEKNNNFERSPSEETATFVSLIQHADSINADQIQANHKTQSSQALTGCSVNTMRMRVALNLKRPYLNTLISLHKGETLFHQLVH